MTGEGVAGFGGRRQKLKAVRGALVVVHMPESISGGNDTVYASEDHSLGNGIEHLVLTGDENAVETYHDRIREVVLGSLGSEGVRERHRQLAFAMEAAGGRDSDALALHFREAGEWERAADYAQMAAEQAAAGLAFDRAARLYRLALEFKPQNDPGRGELTCRLADALANAGRGIKAAKLYLAAAAASPA